MKRNARVARRAKAQTPPTTPPTIAGVLLGLSGAGLGEDEDEVGPGEGEVVLEGGGVKDDLVENDDEVGYGEGEYDGLMELEVTSDRH